VRVAGDQLGSTEPSTSSAARRFSPVRDIRSRRVPVLYAGADLACALGETVFHDLADDPAQPGEVFRADLLTLRAGTICITLDVSLADLKDATLARYGAHRDEVVDTATGEYRITRCWAQHAWDTTTVAGLVWNSRRGPDRLSFMFFVDPPRLEDRGRALDRRRDLDIASPPASLYNGEGLAAVMTAAADRNVTVVL